MIHINKKISRITWISTLKVKMNYLYLVCILEQHECCQEGGAEVATCFPYSPLTLTSRRKGVNPGPLTVCVGPHFNRISHLTHFFKFHNGSVHGTCASFQISAFSVLHAWLNIGICMSLSCNWYYLLLYWHFTDKIEPNRYYIDSIISYEKLFTLTAHILKNKALIYEKLLLRCNKFKITLST